MSASIDRLLRANRTVLVVPLTDGATEPQYIMPNGTLVPFSAPTAALITAWAAIVTTTVTGAGHGGNISCALLDDLSLGLAESEQDTELTICSIGNESTPTFYNVDATLTGFRDKNIADTGVFNLFTQLMNAEDVRYALIDRIGYSSSAAGATGQIVSAYEVHTDAPVDVKEDRGNLKLQQVPVPTGIILSNYAIAS